MTTSHAFILGVTLATLVIALPLGYYLGRSYQHSLATVRAESSRLRFSLRMLAVENYANATKVERTEAALAKAIGDYEWSQVELALTAAGRDMYQTALRGLLAHQAKSDLLEPYAPAGVADVYEFPAGGRG